jgi:hypothetical protein
MSETAVTTATDIKSVDEQKRDENGSESDGTLLPTSTDVNQATDGNGDDQEPDHLPPPTPTDQNQKTIDKIKSSTEDIKKKYETMINEKYVNLDDTLSVLTEMFIALEKYALQHVQELEKQKNLLDIFDIIDQDFKEMLNLIKPLNTTQLNILRKELLEKSKQPNFNKSELLPSLKKTIEKVKDLEEANAVSATASSAGGGKRKKKCNKTKRRRRKK